MKGILVMNKALIVIDMQNDFISGSLGSEMAQAIVPNVKKKIDDCCKKDYFIFFTKDTHNEDYLNTLEGKYLPVEHCIFGTDGWETPEDFYSIPSLKYSFNYLLINKKTFGFDGWKYFIKDDISEIEVCGLCTDICVVSNALILRALFPNTKIVCDATCCAGTTLEKHRAALDVMKSCQIEVINYE